MNTELKLDKWDFAVIYYVKQEPNQTFANIKQIWASRCGLDIYDVNIEALVDHFLPIILELGKINGDLSYSAPWIINDAAPRNKWKFREMGALNEENDPTIEYYNNIFRVICSRLRLSSVRYLVGFDEYYQQRKATMVIV